MTFGHVSGYLSHLATRGEPPSTNIDGEPYSKPGRGQFLIHSKALSALYDTTKEIFLTAQLAAFADGVRNDDRALSWALQGIDTARSRKQHLALPVFGYILIPHLLRDNRFAEALELAAEICAVLVAGRAQAESEGGRLAIGPGELDIGALLGPKPSDAWRKAETLSVETGLLPAAFRISSIALVDPGAARGCATEVADACRKIGANASERDLWTSAADVIELAFVHQIAGRDLIGMVNRFQDETLRTVAYVGASLRSDVPLQSVCEAHLVAAHHAYRSLGSRYPTYRQIVLPFITDYWLKALRGRHSDSIPPSFVLRMLEMVPSIPEEKRAQALLALAAKDLRADVTPSQREWLMEGVNAMQPAARAPAAGD